MKKPLHILVTRPAPFGELLCAAIHAKGDHATYLPTITFDAPKDNALLASQIKEIPEQDVLIFISPQSVFAAMKIIKEIPQHVTLVAVGEGTAKALFASGYQTVIYPEDAHDSEALLDLPLLKSIKGKHVMIVRGENGRTLLATTLSVRGAHVSHLVVYQRARPIITIEPFIKSFQSQPLHAMICTSYEGVNNLKMMLGENGWGLIKNTPLIVVSERIKKLAIDLGFQTIWVSHSANNDALLAFIDEIRSAL